MSASSNMKGICWKSITIWRRDSIQVAGDRLQGTGYRGQVTGDRLQGTGYREQVAGDRYKKRTRYRVLFLLFMREIRRLFRYQP